MTDQQIADKYAAFEERYRAHGAREDALETAVNTLKELWDAAVEAEKSTVPEVRAIGIDKQDGVLPLLNQMKERLAHEQDAGDQYNRDMAEFEAKI